MLWVEGCRRRVRTWRLLRGPDIDPCNSVDRSLCPKAIDCASMETFGPVAGVEARVLPVCVKSVFPRVTIPGRLIEQTFLGCRWEATKQVERRDRINRREGENSEKCIQTLACSPHYQVANGTRRDPRPPRKEVRSEGLRTLVDYCTGKCTCAPLLELRSLIWLGWIAG